VEDDIAGTWLLPPLAVTYLRRTRPEAVAASGSRLADWACAYATTNGYLKFDRFPALDAAWSQVAAALSLIMAGDNRRLQRFCNSIIPFLDLYGKWDEIVLLCTKAEANASEGRDFPQAVYNTFRAGAIFFRRGQAGELKACSDRIAGYIEQNALGAGQRMWAARLRAQWLELTNDNTGALEACREMVAFGQAAMPRSRALATCLGAAADMFARHGHFEEAEGLIHEALAIGRERDDSETISTMVGLLAETALAREQWPEAERLAREALDLSERIRNQVNIARQSRAVAEALARQGRGTEGHQYAERAVTIYAKLRHRLLAEGEATLVACRN
jgi:tetratricopeptide (TPR) repeat protein